MELFYTLPSIYNYLNTLFGHIYRQLKFNPAIAVNYTEKFKSDYVSHERYLFL